MKQNVRTDISVRELTMGYKDLGDNGVISMNGNLNIRPSYQREFVYKDAQRDAVIETIFEDCSLGLFTFRDHENGRYDILDGQQRTISICQYVNGEFSYKGRYFHNLQDDEQEKILSYKLIINFVVGTDSEVLKWFRKINVAGEPLTEQELRNASYVGPWVESAKQYFSKRNCSAKRIAGDYMSGNPIRQDYLETALEWISDNNPEEYMSKHQHDIDAKELINYFNAVITWVEKTFIVKRPKLMKQPWGFLYNKHKHDNLDPIQIEQEIKSLVLDDEVTNKQGIYKYVLTRNEKYLNLRAFTESDKLKLYEQQNGICPICGEHFEIEQMDADHITPWSKGGQTSLENGQMLCKHCNRTKSNK